MAQETGAFDTYEGIGLREDLTDVIYNISPTETPFISNIGSNKAKATRHEWQADTLADATTDNAFVEGDEFSYAEPDPTERLSNICQIMRKTVKISGTLEVVDKAGRRSEMALQVSKRSREIKRDEESIFLDNQASVLGNATTPRRLGGMGSWLETNTSRGTGGADGGYSSTTQLTVAATDATTTEQRVFTEALLKPVLKSTYDNGGTPTMLMLGTFNKQQFSNTTNFPGVSDLRTNYQGDVAKQGRVIGAVDYYISDFGNLRVVPNRFQRERDGWVIDPSLASRSTLRPPKVITPAKTGDADNRVIILEDTLCVKNERGHGVVADLTES